MERMSSLGGFMGGVRLVPLHKSHVTLKAASASQRGDPTSQFLYVTVVLSLLASFLLCLWHF